MEVGVQVDKEAVTQQDGGPYAGVGGIAETPRLSSKVVNVRMSSEERHVDA